MPIPNLGISHLNLLENPDVDEDEADVAEIE